MKNLFKSSNIVLLVILFMLSFASCEKAGLVEEGWTPKSTVQAPVWHNPSNIVLTGDVIDAVPTAIMQELYPSTAASDIMSYASNFDGEGRPTAAIFENGKPMKQIFRMEIGENGTGFNGSKRTQNQFAMAKYGDEFKMAMLNRGNRADRDINTVFEISFTQDTAHAVDVLIQQYDGDFLLEGDFKTMTLLSPQLQTLAARDTINPIILMRNPSKRATVICKDGEMDGWVTEVDLNFDYVQGPKFAGLAARDSVIDDNNLFVEIKAVYDSELGIYAMRFADGVDDQLYKALLDQSTGDFDFVVFGFKPQPTEQLAFTEWGIYYYNIVGGVRQLKAVTRVEEGLTLQTVRILNPLTGKYATFLMPMDEQLVYGHIEQAGFGWPAMLFGFLIFFGMLQKKRQLRFSKATSIIALLLFASFGLQAQNEDRILPSDWLDASVYSWMENVKGKCPTCMSQEQYLKSARKWFWSNWDKYQIEQALGSSQADNYALREQLAAKQAEIDWLHREMSNQLIEKSVAAPQEVTVTVIDSSKTIINLPPAPEPKEEAIEKEEPVKVSTLSIAGLFGGAWATHSRVVNAPCECPGARIGFNDTGNGGTVGVRLRHDPLADTLRVLSFPMEVTALWVAGLDMPNSSERGYIPTFSTAAIKPTLGFGFGKLSIFGGLGIRGSYFADASATFLSIPAHVGGKFQINETTSVSIDGEFPFATKAWLGDNEAQDAKFWQLRASAQFSVWVLKNVNAFIEGSHHGADLGIVEGVTQGGTEFNNIVVGFSVPLGKHLPK